MEEDPLCTLLRNVTDPVFRPDPSTRPGGVAFERVQFPLENALLIAFLLTFIFFKFAHPSRKHFHRLHIRKTYFLVITHFGASICSVTGSYNDLFSLPWTLPCWVFYTFYIMVPACMIVPQITQMITFYRNEQLTLTMVRQQRMNNPLATNDPHQSIRENLRASQPASVDNTSHSDSGSRLSCWQFVQLAICCRRIQSDDSPALTTTLAAATNANQVAPEGEAGGVLSETKSLGPGNQDIQQRFLNDVRVMNFLRSRTAEAVVLSLFFLPFAIAVAVVLGTDAMVANGCWGCTPTESVNILAISLSLFDVVVMTLAYRVNIKKPDPFGIINEIRMIVWIAGVPAVLCLILSTFINLTGDFYIGILVEVFLTVLCFIQSVLQCILAWYDYKREKAAALQYEMSAQDFEEQVIKVKGPYHSAFEAHLASEHGYESLAFLRGVDQWEREFFDLSAKTNRVRARKLMNMYVGDQAALPCNLPDSIIRKMENQMKSSEDLERTFFKLAKDDIMKMLYRDSFARFLDTKAFRKCREELIQQGVHSVKLSA